MKFVIVTHALHSQDKNQYFGYSPYVREMNIWLKYVDELIIVAPTQKAQITAIDCSYNFKNIQFLPISTISLLGFGAILNTILKAPKICWEIYKAMRQADHIHLRCPGNIGLLGCFIQMLFPAKPKTAKYAGNWDPKSKQPWSYRLQKWLLSNTFLTRNMQVLVYGDWGASSRNIKPFFTATYSEADKIPVKPLDLKEKIRFVFVGTLAPGKNPFYAIQLVEGLIKKGYDVSLDLYGEGKERKFLEEYIKYNVFGERIVLQGNHNQETVKMAYQNSHFVILPSKSEGWPKAIAEGMFWGCVPIATSVSCVPFMLDYGERGVLLQMDLELDIQQVEAVIQNEKTFHNKRKKAVNWSQKFTMNLFEEEIEKLINK